MTNNNVDTPRSFLSPLHCACQLWFMLRSTDPLVIFRERALRLALPNMIVLRLLAFNERFRNLEK